MAQHDLQKPDLDDEDPPLLRVTTGPFAGAIGVLVGTTPSAAAQVRLTVAGEGVTVELPSKDCAAIH